MEDSIGLPVVNGFLMLELGNSKKLHHFITSTRVAHQSDDWLFRRRGSRTSSPLLPGALLSHFVHHGNIVFSTCRHVWRNLLTTVPIASSRLLVGLHECEIIPPDQNCVHVPRLSWDSASATSSRRHRYWTPSMQHMSKGRAKRCWLDAGRETCGTSRCGQQSNRREQCDRRGSCAQG